MSPEHTLLTQEHTPVTFPFTDAVSSSFSQSPLDTSPPPLSPNGQVSRRRLKLLSALRSPGANRRATAEHHEYDVTPRQSPVHTKSDAGQHEFEIEAARRSAEEEAARLIEEENAMRLAMAQEEAKGNVKSHMQLFLSSTPPSEEELSVVFFTCAEACKAVGLDFAMVLQEPLIEGQPPVYWAILNRPTTYGKNSRSAYNSLVFALLDACQPLTSPTLAAVRRACIAASDNALLQRLFRHIPELSPLSTTDAMLLAPLNENDVVDVVETRDGTGSFVAHIKILRFRLRMRVSKCAFVEFVASGAFPSRCAFF